MKCPKCATQWQLPPHRNVPLTVCPFCGCSLQTEPDCTLSTIEAVLEEIIRRFGPDILKDGFKTVAIFTDLAPQLRREKLLLSYLMQFDRHILLLESKDLDSGRQVMAYQRVVRYLTDEQLIAPSAAEAICTSFLKAIGVTIASPAPEEAPEPPQSTSTPPKMPKKESSKSTASRNPAPRHTTQVVNTYAKYLKALEDYFLSCGKVQLTSQQIQHFISSNNLDKGWKINQTDVAHDLSFLYRKYNVPTSTPVFISNYSDYIRTLTKLYVDNGRKMLSLQQIEAFLHAHSLDRRFGITVFDVQSDLRKIMRKQ